MSEPDMYQLSIVDDKGMHTVCGQKEPLLAAFDEWKESVGQPDGVGDDIMEVEGFDDNFVRSPVSIVFKGSDVKSMSLTKL